MGRRVEDRARDLVRLAPESVALQTERDDAVVVGPDRPALVGDRVERGILGAQGSDSPAPEQVLCEKATSDGRRPVLRHDLAPEELAGVRGDRLNLLLTRV